MARLCVQINIFRRFCSVPVRRTRFQKMYNILLRADLIKYHPVRHKECSGSKIAKILELIAEEPFTTLHLDEVPALVGSRSELELR